MMQDFGPLYTRYLEGDPEATEQVPRMAEAHRRDQLSQKGISMEYTPMPGDIGLTSISGPGGKAIRFAQWLNGGKWTKVQHAFVVTDGANEYRRELIVEAMPGGAQCVRNRHAPDETVYLRCPDEYGEAVAAIAKRQAIRKVGYSDADYFALAAHRLHIPAPHLKAYIQSSGHQICSQLADYCADKGGWHLFDDGRWEGFVTPNDLYALYLAQQ